MAVESPTETALLRQLAQTGHIFLAAPQTRALLELHGALDDWDAFAASWEGMPVDTYMADGGRYRRRRHANFRAGPAGVVRGAHQPHYQSRDYNTLHGGIERWFEPVQDAIADGASLRTIINGCHRWFGALAPAVRDWFIEVHQFRIEARAGESGQPTPEGVHRDGVDYVLVLLVRRDNIASGTTSIHAPDGADLGSFTLTAPFDAVLVDDARVYHGVTPVTPLDPLQPACRDVLVVTFRRA